MDNVYSDNKVVEVVKHHGRLVVGDGGELMVEFSDQQAVESLAEDLKSQFGEQIQLAP